MKQTRLQRLNVVAWGAFALTMSGSAHASEPAWGWSLNGQRYSEPAMQLTGVGLGLRYTRQPPALAPWTIAIDADVARLRYSSDTTGDMAGKTGWDTRWQLLRDMGAWGPLPFQAGLSLRTSWNDLRGTTSTQNQGYVRENLGLWASFRWRQPAVAQDRGLQYIRYNLDVLLAGQQRSYLSQVSTARQDVTNRQTQGISFGIQGRWRLNAHDLEPYIHYSWIGKSNTVSDGMSLVTEPRNERWQLGIIFWH